MNLAHELRSFTGSVNFYQHPLLVGARYTEGVQFFMENSARGNGSYWLLDIILTEGVELHVKEPFVVIEVDVEASPSTPNFPKAVITFSDGNGKVLKKKKPIATDLEEGQWRFWLTDGVLMLPTEY